MENVTPENVNALLRVGFSASKLRMTQLHVATFEDNAVEVSRLLGLGADPTIRTVESLPRTPLEYAERYGCENVAKILRAYMQNTIQPR